MHLQSGVDHRFGISGWSHSTRAHLMLQTRREPTDAALEILVAFERKLLATEKRPIVEPSAQLGETGGVGDLEDLKYWRQNVFKGMLLIRQ